MTHETTMSDRTSITDPSVLRWAAVVVAVTGLLFVFMQDTWMIASSVTLSGGLFLLAEGELHDDPRQRRFGYLGLGLAFIFLLIDILISLSRVFA